MKSSHILITGIVSAGLAFGLGVLVDSGRPGGDEVEHSLQGRGSDDNVASDLSFNTGDRDTRLRTATAEEAAKVADRRAKSLKHQLDSLAAENERLRQENAHQKSELQMVQSCPMGSEDRHTGWSLIRQAKVIWVIDDHRTRRRKVVTDSIDNNPSRFSREENARRLYDRDGRLQALEDVKKLLGPAAEAEMARVVPIIQTLMETEKSKGRGHFMKWVLRPENRFVHKLYTVLHPLIGVIPK